MNTMTDMAEQLDVKLLLATLMALKKGDFSVRMPSDWTGVSGKIADTLNDIIETKSKMVEAVTEVSRVVGREGHLTQRADVPGVVGGWSTLITSVNSLIDDLVRPTTEMARVIGAVAKGDLSQTMALEVDGHPLKGQYLRAATTANTMVEQLSSFSSEVTRVAREVGTEGKLGGQAQVKGVAGTWKDLTDSVNSMAGNLTSQVRNIAEVTTAVANGDLSKKITVDVRGEILQLKDTINVMVDQLRSFASEVTRVAREVGTEGKLGGQAYVPGVGGTWKDLTDNVNFMASNLTGQVRNIATVTTAVANGDLSKKITVDVKGEILELKNTINVMVDQLSSFSSEVTRVAREVGTEGKLGGQAQVKGVAGTWKDLTDSVNSMAGNLTGQVRNIADVTTAVANGDLSKKITVDVKGEILELKNTINVMVDQLNSFASEVTRVAREVGTEGRLGGQANVPGVAGTWKDLTDGVNSMAGNLTGQVRNIADVTTAVANGDLSKKITVDVKGEILELKNTINVMVDQLSSFASEVTRVAREVGTEGKLGGQAYVPGVGGTWKDLTDNVNFMASNLTGQVRNIAAVTTAVARGDLSKKITVDVKGEILELKDTINVMVDQLSSFASEVTRVAREVGTEGKLGGQANVSGVAGTWKDLTENVNQLAANLTNQMRAIGEVATAVTRGDLSRSIQVEARGEVSYLKDNINEMIRNLKETTQKNAQQDWLKTNLARFTRLLQGQRDLGAVTKLILSELAPLVSAHHGVFYMMDSQEADARLRMIASYGYRSSRKLPTSFSPGEGLVGQCALEKTRIWLTDVPRDYIVVSSGLGSAPPNNIVVLPILFEQQVKAVIEIASLDRFTETHLSFLDQLMESIGVVLNTIEANSRTESLLTQSQSLAQELQQTNQELAEKARLLSEQNIEVERKNREVEQAKLALEEKATQLALSSKYKSEFLANMSHELRTPLNSLLILAQQLSDNPEGNLSGKQVEFAKTIHGSGSDLLTLINDILDLSKIESGTVTLDVSEYRFANLRNYVDRTFRHMAEAKHLGFQVGLAENLPTAVMTDTTRLQQVLKNLLSNAFKFTSHGQVALNISLVTSGWTRGPPAPAACGRGARVLGQRQRRRHPVGQAAADLRSLPAGRRLDRPQVRRHGSRPVDFARTGAPAGRRDSRRIDRQRRLDLHALPAVQPRRLHQLRSEPPAPACPPGGPERSADCRADHLCTGRGDRKRRRRHHRSAGADQQQPGRIRLDAGRPRPDRPGRPVGADRRGRRPLRQDRARTGAREELQGHRHPPRRLGPVAGARLPALGDPARHRPAGHRRLHGARPPEARPEHPPHPGARGLGTARARARAAPGRDLLPQQAGGARGAGRGIQPHPEVPGRRQAFLAGGGRRHGPARADREPDRRQRPEHGDRGNRRRRDGSARRPALRLHGARPDAAGHFRLRPARPDRQEAALRDLPIVIYTAQELSRKEVTKLKKYAKTIVIKDARSPERLLDETALFLHRSHASLPELQRKMLEEIHALDGGLAGRKVLIVDDDLRNIFALSSLLERQQMQVLFAENGRDGIEVLEKDPTIEIVLMDIMMPEMDGYDTMRAIRRIPKFKSLPIITLTAKAMKGDRDKCIAAGASDYITKPVDVAQLLSLMRVWLH